MGFLIGAVVVAAAVESVVTVIGSVSALNFLRM